MLPRKFESGYSKRKKKQRLEQLTQSLVGGIHRYFPTTTTNNQTQSVVQDEHFTEDNNVDEGLELLTENNNVEEELVTEDNNNASENLGNEDNIDCNESDNELEVPMNGQHLGIGSMLKKEEEMISAVKEKQLQLAGINNLNHFDVSV
ncbi:hypothetical protein FRX31_018090 [Thalictrum thalictroides]|uniref:Uncharacterized protein n=1 Tax=Thalictrum thalictroides TaxID=46969 RepID=A0A7J6W783_THATH|nr:hypothetical protein FRX31_018090 [Thalictrum thalictroides]